MKRRTLLKTCVATAAAFQMPYIALGSRHSDEIVLGDGDFQYRVNHNFFQIPNRYNFQTTHNVAVDSQGMVYVIHEGKTNYREHPSIFVFDNKGRFVKAFGKQFQGGGHGIEIRNENGEDFLYVCAYQSLKMFAKLTTDGKQIWEKRAPMESERYAKGEDTDPKQQWGRNRFMPTNFAFLNDGGFLLADGYGSFAIHRYDKDANYVSSFGRPGKANGEFQTPHGLWIDRRNPNTEMVVIADRANMRLQWFTLDWKHIRTQDGFLLPANIDTQGDLMLVPELQARITILGRDNQPVAKLGDDSEWRKQVLAKGNNLRSRPMDWKAGKFLHPHDACFDADGNILVAEWVATGRVSKLTKV